MSTASDLDTWRLFFRVVSKGSIAKVSEEMRIEPSSISRRINKLEAELGINLFQRKGKQLVLTTAGSLAYSRMRRVVFDAAALIRDLQQTQTADSKIITIAAPIGFSEIILSQALAEYRDHDPDVSFTLRSLSYIELLSADSMMSYDIVLTAVPLNIPTRDSQLICGVRHIVAATTEFVRSLHYPIRSPRDLADHPTFSFYSRNRERNQLLRKGTESYPLPLHSSLRFNHPGAIKTILMQSKGIGLYCPQYFYIEEMEKALVQEILPEWSLPIQQVYLSRKDRNRLEVERFVHWLEQYLAHFPGLIPPNAQGFWTGDFTDQAPYV